jgi:hypothetical protein
MDRACSTNGEKRNAYRILVGKPEGKRPVGRPRRRWVNNIKTDRNRWRALVNTVMNLRVPYNAGKFLSSCTFGGFSRRAQLHE